MAGSSKNVKTRFFTCYMGFLSTLVLNNTLFLGMCESLRKGFFPIENNVQETSNKGGNLGDHYCWGPAWGP